MQFIEEIRIGMLVLSLSLLFIGEHCLNPATTTAAERAAVNAPSEVAPFLPQGVKELTFIKAPWAANLYIAAYMYRSSNWDPLSSIIVVRLDRTSGKPKLLWQSKEEQLYAPKIIVEKKLTYEGAPLVMVDRQSGAAWHNLDVIGWRDQRPVLVCTLKDVVGYELKSLAPGQAPVVVVFRKPYVTPLPEIYAWDGKQFVSATTKYPQYYEDVLKKGFHFQDESVKPLEVAIMTTRAGYPEKAKKLLEDWLAAEKRRGPQADKYRINAIEQELKALNDTGR
jgi:hypothetical protein